MRLGPALLVVLLPLLAIRADYTSTSNENDTAQSGSTGPSSNSVQLPSSKPTSSTSKTSTSTNTIPPDKSNKSHHNKNTTMKSNLTTTATITDIDINKDGIGKNNKDDVHVQHVVRATEKLQTESLKTQMFKRKNLTVGYLTAVKGDVKDRQGLSVSGALTMALKEVIKI